MTDDLRVLLLRRLVEVFDSLPAAHDDAHGRTLRALRHLVAHGGVAGGNPDAQEVSGMLDEIDAGSLGAPEAIYRRLLANPRAVAQTLTRAGLDNFDRDTRTVSPRVTTVDDTPIDAHKPKSVRFSSTSLVKDTSLVSELRALRRGRGVRAPGIDKQVGPALREVCGISPSDGPEAVRAKVGRWVAGIVEEFPVDLRLAVLVPLGLHSEAPARFLSERIAWLSGLLDRDARTTRRRIDVGLTRLAEAAMNRVSLPAPPLSDEESGWHVSEFEALLRLYSPTPRYIERYTICADQDGVEEIDWAITLPPVSENGVPGELDVEVLHGVGLISVERPDPRRSLLHLRLPRPLQAGQTHEFSLELRVPKGQPIHPTYVFWPERPCENFRLVARFRANDPPAALWRVNGAFHHDLDDPAEGSDLLTVNGIGEVEVSFSNLLPDRGYGVQWLPRRRPRAPDLLEAPRPRRISPHRSTSNTTL